MTTALDRQLPTRPKKPRAKPSRPAGAEPAASRAGTHLAAAMHFTAPLRLFELSDLNVRKSYDPAGIADMANDLALRGMKQNLVAIPSPQGGGRLAVVAGGRRLRGWWRLLDEGRASPDQEIAYLLEEPGTARETSLAENVQKEALNPADEVEAFASVVADHAADPDPILHCATRFGKSRRYVEQQLRLADLAIDILDALRAGRIDLDAARAYATFGDHDAQLTVFYQEDRREHGVRHSARNIRETMRGRSYPAEIAQALYVGLDAYRAAGGRVDRELVLGADDGERLLDPALLDDLARRKATAALPACAAADGLASGVLTLSFVPSPNWPRPPATHVQRPGVHPDQLDDALRASAIGVYNIAPDGSGLELVGLMTAIALPARTPAAASPPPVPAPPLLGQTIPINRSPPIAARIERDESAEAYLARTRAHEVRRRAALLAARAIVTAALPEDRLVLGDSDDYFESLETGEDGDVLVMIQVKVHPAELEAMRAEAEAAIDADEDERDLVAAADGMVDEEVGGGGVTCPPSAHSRS